MTMKSYDILNCEIKNASGLPSEKGLVACMIQKTRKKARSIQKNKTSRWKHTSNPLSSVNCVIRNNKPSFSLGTDWNQNETNTINHLSGSFIFQSCFVKFLYNSSNQATDKVVKRESLIINSNSENAQELLNSCCHFCFKNLLLWSVCFLNGMFLIRNWRWETR